jgi:serine protease Do
MVLTRFGKGSPRLIEQETVNRSADRGAAPDIRPHRGETMNTHIVSNRVKGGVAAAVAAVTLFAGGATWRGWAAEQPAAQVAASAPAAPQTSSAAPRARAIAADGRTTYADIVDAVAPAVVTVRAEGRARVANTQFQGNEDLFREFFGGRVPQMRRPRQQAMGSGVVVSADGYILTNHHVIDGADAVRVDFTDGRQMTAKVIGTDAPSDLALLKVDATGLATVPMGDSNAVHVGDVVLAVGNPLNVGQTVTMGIVSAKGRSTPGGDGAYEDFLQTDAPINHGNSGGALVNMRGELVGINSQIVSNTDAYIGIGFAIPSNMARRVMDDLRTTGTVTRAQLGVNVQTVDADMAASLGLKQPGGVIVSGVTPGSAAEKAGLKRGDIIQSLNGQPVRDMNTLRNRIADSTPNANAELVVLRDGAERTITARLDVASPRTRAGEAERDADGADQTSLGVAVAPLTPQLASRLGVPEQTKGLVVQDVAEDGRAVVAGIRPGDVIQEVNRQPVGSVAELRAALKQGSDKPALLLINRQGADIFVTVRPANG